MHVLHANELFSFVAQPLLAKLPQGGNLIATGVMSPFTTPVQAVVLRRRADRDAVRDLPAVGLRRARACTASERRFAVPLLVSAILLFYVGIAFAYYFVFPVMFQFFASTTPKGVAMMTDINNYLDFVLTMFFCFGLAFEVPVAVVLLVVMGMVRVESLAEEPRLRAHRHLHPGRAAHPPDAIAQCSLAIPMYLLYEGGILMARRPGAPPRPTRPKPPTPAKPEAVPTARCALRLPLKWVRLPGCVPPRP